MIITMPDFVLETLSKWKREMYLLEEIPSAYWILCHFHPSGIFGVVLKWNLMYEKIWKKYHKDI
jgi:hypothetical protein